MPGRPIPLSPTLRPRSGLLLGGLIFSAIVGGYLALRPREEVVALPGGQPPATACTLWFVGSSTIARWSTLADDMKPWDARGRGANGALIPAITQRLALDGPGPAPAAIIFYAGENDIAAGHSPQQALAAFDRFMALKTRRYPNLPVIAVSLKPSPARLTQRAGQTAFNRGLMHSAARRADLHVVDIGPLLLVGGRPGPFYVTDGLHMNAAGYARWTPMILRAVARAVPPATMARCLSRKAG